MTEHSSQEPHCYTDFALQEFVAGRLEEGVRAAVARHAEGCTFCRRWIEVFQRERDLLRVAVGGSFPGDPADCLSVERLGLFYDGSLDADSRDSTVLHLVECPRCRAELAAIVDELAEFERREIGDELRPEPAGIVLTMRPRMDLKPRPFVATDEDQAAEGL